MLTSDEQTRCHKLQHNKAAYHLVLERFLKPFASTMSARSRTTRSEIRRRYGHAYLPNVVMALFEAKTRETKRGLSTSPVLFRQVYAELVQHISCAAGGIVCVVGRRVR